MLAGTGRRTPRTRGRCWLRRRHRFLIYSGSKAITAFVVHMLHERGALHIEDRVSGFIPEYAANGKGEITIAHVLAHRAAVPALPAGAFDLDRGLEPDFHRRGAVRCQAVRQARAVSRLPRGLGWLHSRRGGAPGHREEHPHGPGRGDPRPVALLVERLRGQAKRTSRPSPSITWLANAGVGPGRRASRLSLRLAKRRAVILAMWPMR